MLRTTRHRTLLLLLVVLMASSIIGFATNRVRDAILFSHLSAAEKQVIGVWTWTTIDAIGRMRIRSDHTFDEWFVEPEREEDHPDSRSVSHGRWSIEGAEFVYIHDPPLSEALRDWKPPHIPISDFGDGMKKVY
jgi:hypothetical protein